MAKLKALINSFATVFLNVHNTLPIEYTERAKHVVKFHQFSRVSGEKK